MVEPRRFEDEATLYVLGLLDPTERQQFEARMKKSPELRALVHELEAGTVALSMAMPQRQPPPQAWERIRDAVTTEEQNARSAFAAWLRSGWAAAACVALGWSIYVLWIDRPATPDPNRPGLSTELGSTQARPGDSVRADRPRVAPLPTPPEVASPPGTSPLARVGEIAMLRRHVLDLEGQLAHLSQILTQQQTMPLQFGRLTFLNLAPPGADPGAARSSIAAPPELQRALLIALARDLGWTQLAVQEQKGGVDPGVGHDPAVEFIELPLNSDAPTPTPTQNTPRSPPVVAKSDPSPSSDADPANPSGSAIPGYQFGTNVVLAIGSSVVPPGTDSLTVWAGTATGDFQARGSLTIGNSPTVVRIPFFHTASGWNITVTAGPGTAPPTSVNTIGVFTAP